MHTHTYHHLFKQGAPGAPLLVTLHGTGGSETQFHGFAEGLLPQASVLSPRGDVSEHGAARFFRRTGEGVYDMADLARATRALSAFIREMAAKAGTDAVYGFGFSNGANILAAMLFEEPDLFQRAALLHPLIPFRPKPQPGLAGRRVLITAGRRDPICPPPLTDALATYLREQGAETTLLWHEGGHEIRQPEVDALASLLG
ncbi:alpha/beta hydrolase [Rhizobium sp. CC-YZS058]|uniref:alpha/beta hydrolase n=1 Tax=Rhizobium sp. CC-YZS058 TaxID=3042153 RepID=UPI002B05776A|nr:alpha/beta hydrolase [Rhizobium sp. CC-YZS058]MEA3536424.1 alpha/beta hydrolase [Rhizobium sp. CC-YZS058]